MKKNKAMRTASGLMIATLLTTSIISGTIAKYTTEDSAYDVARVAKWGVTVQTAGKLYGSDYEKNDATSGQNVIKADYTGSVDSGNPYAADNDNIMAPGTKSENGLYFSIEGTPEVMTQVSGQVVGSDIYLKAGDYGLMVPTSTTEAVTEDNYKDMNNLYIGESTNGMTFTKVTNQSWTTVSTASLYTLEDEVTAVNYFPVTYGLTTTNGTPGNATTYNTNLAQTTSKSTMSEMAAEIAKAAEVGSGTGTAPTDNETTKPYAFNYKTTGNATKYSSLTDLTGTAGVKLNGENIIWEWKFENETTTNRGNDATVSDKSDTILGHMIVANADTVNHTTDDGAYVVYKPTAGNTYKEVKYDTETISVTAVGGTTSYSKDIVVVKDRESAQSVIACLTSSLYLDLAVTQVD
ncbi:MAG: hypothetical protein Q4F24_01285 [Eubacteriales bacterium]|nr:hypothetical protein [Eubacteriales bacterium]